MQIVVSIFLDLKLVNMQNTRSVAFMQREITFEFYLSKERFFIRRFKLSQMNFLIKKFRYDFFFNKEWIFVLKKEDTQI